MAALDFYDAEQLAWRLISERADTIPGLVARPASPLHPWTWKAERHSVQLWIRFRPGETYEQGGKHYVRCSPQMDVHVEASPRDGGDMAATLRLSRRIEQLAREVGQLLATREIVRQLEWPATAPRPAARGPARGRLGR